MPPAHAPHSRRTASIVYESLPTPDRPKLRPPIGIPVPQTSRLRSTLASVALHAAVIALLVVPFALPSVVREITGIGGPTPAGGGGGGLHGSGGDLGGKPVVERLRFVQLATPAPAAVPPAVKPPVIPPVPPPPVVPPPVTPKPVPSKPVTPAATSSTTPAASSVTAAVAGSGGGTGADGTLGSGPGTGGGVGSGVGNGNGSGVGASTGGGAAASPSPTMIETFLPPYGAPKRDKGRTIVAVFDVDSTGRVLKVDFTQVSDGGYNRKLREAFEGCRFRPAVKPDGTPVRAKASLEYVL
ncbi:hypothetical protein tb265_35180 [Gemmatimonadetes bacterium T265]|nr:hypothetical protein tb265_35180 [Gemmatimonadetes bacterium T265]